MSDILAAMGTPCGSCGEHRDSAAWSHAWQEWLCHLCRLVRTESELRMHRDRGERALLRKAGILA